MSAKRFPEGSYAWVLPWEPYEPTYQLVDVVEHGYARVMVCKWHGDWVGPENIPFECVKGEARKLAVALGVNRKARR